MGIGLLKRQRILYLCVLDNPVQKMKLSGVRRYADARHWDVVPVPAGDSAPAMLPALLSRHRPVGCIVECAGNDTQLKPQLLGRLPAVWLDVPAEALGGIGVHPCVCVDDESIARTALRELSATMPRSLAAVEYQWFPHEERRMWSRNRAEEFRALAFANGMPCEVFEAGDREALEARAARLADFLSRQPRPCGVFAVNDGAAHHVRAACSAAYLSVPREISVIGVDNDVALCEASAPGLSSIKVDFERMGYAAAKMIGDALAARDGNGRTGKSTSPAKGKSDTPILVGPLLAVRRRSTGGRGRREPRILEAMEMIRREACSGLTAEKLAKRFAGSRRHFERRFREAVGHSILDEILQVRLERAFTLLADTDTAIGAIYAHCGFRTPDALDYLVRDRTGLSARDWRNRNRRK